MNSLMFRPKSTYFSERLTNYSPIYTVYAQRINSIIPSIKNTITFTKSFQSIPSCQVTVRSYDNIIYETNIVEITKSYVIIQTIPVYIPSPLFRFYQLSITNSYGDFFMKGTNNIILNKIKFYNNDNEIDISSFLSCNTSPLSGNLLDLASPLATTDVVINTVVGTPLIFNITFPNLLSITSYSIINGSTINVLPSSPAAWSLIGSNNNFNTSTVLHSYVRYGFSQQTLNSICNNTINYNINKSNIDLSVIAYAI